MERKAPKGGYDFQSKAEYRDQVWEQFAKAVPDVNTARVAFLPSKEGLEIPVALKYGFKEENLVAIDKNKSLIAVSKWRKEYPKVKFYGSELARAGARMNNDNVVVDAANLDLCGNLSVPMLNSIISFVSSGALKSKSLLAVTMMKGREGKEIAGILGVLSKLVLKRNEGADRLAILMEVGAGTTHQLTHNVTKEYKSSSGTMMIWGIYSLISKEYINNILQTEAKRRDVIEAEATVKLDVLMRIHSKLTCPIRLVDASNGFKDRYGLGDLMQYLTRGSLNGARRKVLFRKHKRNIRLNKKQATRLCYYIIFIQIRIKFLQNEITNCFAPVDIGNTTYRVPLMRRTKADEWYPSESDRGYRSSNGWHIHFLNEKKPRKALLNFKGIHNYIQNEVIREFDTGRLEYTNEPNYVRYLTTY